MKITAKLAKNQLKVNRSRTIWTLLAIVMSTALTTAVCSFIASGNAMLKEFLGDQYGEYGGTYLGLLLIPAVIFGFLIMAMSVTVISNVFRISAQERISQFGVMKCTGATAKQIKDTIMYESIFLCVMGLPAGIIVGVVLAFLAVCVANHFLDDLASLAHIMIQEITLTLHFVFSWQAILFSAIFSFLTVLYSAWRPAYKTAKVSAIQCIHGTSTIKMDEKQLKNRKLVQKIFGFEGTLADKNLKRNHRNFKATVIALSVGIILFISLGGLSKQAEGIQKFMDPGIDETVIAEYISGYSDDMNEKTGREETTFLHPISSELGNQITQKLEEHENTKIWGIGNDIQTYYTILSKEQVNQEMREAYEEEDEEEKEEYEFPVEIITIDEKNYESLCEKAGVSVGSTVLLNHYRYNDFGHEVDLEPFSSSMTELEIRRADGSTSKVSVDGMLVLDQIPAELIYFGCNPVRLVVPEASVRGYSWYSKPEDEKAFMEYANDLLEKEFPNNSDASYMEEGFSTRVYKMDEYMKVMNIAISLVTVFMYSFVALLMLIGLTNVISTLSTNVMMRAKEFAVLKSVGMTPESLRRMLGFESILCSIKALSVGVPIGIVITIFINIPIRIMYPITYQVPWLSIGLCILVVFLITYGTTKYAVHKLAHQNIIEAIRSECRN